jgi:hypothetical protein
MSIAPAPFFYRRELLPLESLSLYQRTCSRVNLGRIADAAALVTGNKPGLPWSLSQPARLFQRSIGHRLSAVSPKIHRRSSVDKNASCSSAYSTNPW